MVRDPESALAETDKDGTNLGWVDETKRAKEIRISLQSRHFSDSGWRHWVCD